MRDPLVSVLLAVHNGERYLAAALDSIFRQTLRDLEVVVVDDASTDGTADLLARLDDPRLVVVRNDEQLGLARSLNRGLERAGGRFVARLDADDLALPHRLERQVARLTGNGLGIVGSAVLEVDADDRPLRLHAMPATPGAVRWHALFGAPFYHPTVLLDRELLGRHGLCYDPAFAESEDYELWSRLLSVTDGANLPDALVVYRIHPGQATQRRRDLQRSLQRDVGIRQIGLLAPALGSDRAALAWALGVGERVPPERAHDAIEAYVELTHAFTASHGADGVREAAARTLVRAGAVREALALDAALPFHAAARRRRRKAARRRALAAARPLLRGIRPSLRVTSVSPEPTPYRAPLFDRVARHPDLELTVVYAARTVAGRSWDVAHAHEAVVLRGRSPRAARRILRHDYPVTPGIFRVLGESRPDCVVVSGWSTFAAQVAILWCRLRRVPYVVLVESHDTGPKAGWRRVVKGSVVPAVLRGASSVLVAGSLARDSVVSHGARPERVRVFANTIDVASYAERCHRASTRRQELRRRLGLADDAVAVLCVARLVPEKDIDTLLRASAIAGVRPVLAGSGPERSRLERLAGELSLDAIFLGERPWDELVEVYVSADVFALLSEHEPWGVVVNEAAACSLPLVLSNRVGAAADLLREAENGFLVPAGDVGAAAEALRRLAADAELRRRFGERSRELVDGWGYDASVDNFVIAVREAVG
jgi:glycosyltransferase involved in cell wall biosynthesis